MSAHVVLSAITMATLLRPVLISAQQAVPRFEDFPVEAMFDRTPAPVILASARARMFRTVLTMQAKERPNFAGQYRVATWGCGSDCHAFAIINAKTGTVYFHPDALWIGGLPGNDEDRIQFRKNSRLFVLAGARNDQGEGKYYYEWTGTRLKLIRTAAAVTVSPRDSVEPSTGVEASCDFSTTRAHPDRRKRAAEFLRRDAAGDFLRSDPWFDGATDCPGHEPGPNTLRLARLKSRAMATRAG